MKPLWWLISLLSCLALYADSSTKMEGAVNVSYLPPYPVSYWALSVIVTCVLSAVFFSNSKRQRMLPSVPVVGLDGTKTIRQARQQFRHDSKTMLLEGYRKVFLHVPIFDLDYNFLAQRKSLLCSDEYGGATHDPCQVCGGAQECACLASRFPCYFRRGWTGPLRKLRIIVLI